MTQAFAKDQLKSFIERIEKLEEEKAALAADIREVYSEAKSDGFDPKIMRQIVRERKLGDADRQEQEAILELYREALGMLADTPLGQAALTASQNRDTRSRARLSEGMKDTKEISCELANAGLISEEAGAENRRIADAVAIKYGNGIA